MNGQWGTQFINADGSSGYVAFVTFSYRLLSSLSRVEGRNASTAPEMTSAAANSFFNFPNSSSSNSSYSSNFPNSLSAQQFSFSSVLGETRPRIPPLVFGAREVLLLTFDAAPSGSAPISLFRRHRVLRALGCLPTGVVLPPAAVSQQASALAPANLGPFRGDHSYAFWNAQAFFAADTLRHSAKVGYACHLLAQHDMVGLAEVHGMQSETEAWRRPHGIQGFFFMRTHTWCCRNWPAGPR